MSARKRKMIEKANRLFTHNERYSFRALMISYRFWKMIIKRCKPKALKYASKPIKIQAKNITVISDMKKRKPSARNCKWCEWSKWHSKVDCFDRGCHICTNPKEKDYFNAYPKVCFTFRKHFKR